MFMIEYTLATGEIRHSQPIGDAETADRWRRLLLQDPCVLEAHVLSAMEDKVPTTNTVSAA